MKTSRETVEYYLAKFREGERDDAFHGLIESDPDVVTELIAAYDLATGLEVKAFVVRVITEFRRPVSMSFLKQELLAKESEIWKGALDALVIMESPESVAAMEEARCTVPDPLKKEWIGEAIRDTAMRIKEGVRSRRSD